MPVAFDITGTNISQIEKLNFFLLVLKFIFILYVRTFFTDHKFIGGDIKWLIL